MADANPTFLLRYSNLVQILIFTEVAKPVQLLFVGQRWKWCICIIKNHFFWAGQNVSFSGSICTVFYRKKWARFTFSTSFNVL